MRIDCYTYRGDRKANYLIFQTAIAVVVLGVGIGFFVNILNVPAQEYPGFTTVNVKGPIARN